MLEHFRGPRPAEHFPAKLEQPRDLLLRAGRLQKHGTAAKTRLALALLGRLVHEARDPSELAAAHAQRARCLRMPGRVDEAVAAYRSALEAEREIPRLRPPTYLEFAELVLTLGREELFREALATLEEFSPGENFPVESCQVEVIRARLQDGLGEQERAKRTARQATARIARTRAALRDDDKCCWPLASTSVLNCAFPRLPTANTGE